VKNIRLSIERFWIETGNFELWCEILSRIPYQTEAKTMKEIATKYLNKDIMNKDNKLDRSKELFGLLGYEQFKRSEQFELKGVHLLQRREGYLQPTEEARNLVNAYLQDDGWQVLLAKQLLRYSPRSRVIFHILLNGGTFHTNNVPLANFGRWELDIKGDLYHPFASNPKINDMNYLLQEYKNEALGNDWMNIIRANMLELDENWSFIGSGGKEPAKTNLTAFMRAPMQLFDYLDWFIQIEERKVILNEEKVKDDIDGLDNIFKISKSSLNELDSLKEIIIFYSDDRGFIAVEPALEELLKKHYPLWDKGLARFVDYYITNGVKEGLFTIDSHESGQPRHGRGYLGKREYQLMRLDIHR